MSQILGAGGGGGLSTSFPMSSSSPGTTGTLAYDPSGNLYLCYAPNAWTKFTGTTPFGVTGFLLLSDGSSHILLTDGVSKLLL